MDFFLYADILSEKLQHSIAVGDAGKDTLGVNRSERLQRKIRGYDRGFLINQTFVNTGKKFRVHKGVSQFGSQIVNNQEITVVDMFCGICSLSISVKTFVSKILKKFLCGKIYHGMGSIQQFFGNTVREKRLAHTGIAIEEQIGKSLVKLTDKPVADLCYTMNTFQR